MQEYRVLIAQPQSLRSLRGHFDAPLPTQSGTHLTQIQNLRRTRDLLLPRLLSGQLELEVA